MAEDTSQAVAHEWVSFPGGELEGRRPRALCPACRKALQAAANRGSAPRHPTGRRGSSGPLCFQCYRIDLDRDRALRAAGNVDTGSVARFQEPLPFEPISEGRLAVLKVERALARTDTRGALLQGAGRFADRRRRAQIAARHALQTALQTTVASRPAASASAVFDRTIAAALHAAELQLPESWMPFVISR